MSTPELPAPCDLCRGQGGLYRIVERRGVECTARCTCPRGVALASMDEQRINKPPTVKKTLDVQKVIDLVGEWTQLQYFPKDDDGRFGIVRSVCEMCCNMEDVEFLIAELPRRFNQWPGPLEVRALLCESGRETRDGVKVLSAVYPDGFPVPSAPRMREIEGHSEGLKPISAGDL